MQETITSPYAPITGQGLGICYSSFNKVGTLFLQKGFGSAGLSFYPNLSNGNLVFKDRILKIFEENFPLELGFVYNSQVDDPNQAWKFSIKKFKQLPTVQPSGGTGILQEADGHLTTYLQDSKNPENIFYAQESINSTKFLHFDAAQNLWLLQDPKSADKEYYDLQGLLCKKINSRGRETQYEYDNNQQLTAIMGPTGNRYEIRRQAGNVGLYDANHETLLQAWMFDSANRLVLSQTPDGYSTNYTYSDSENNNAKLKTVTQSDNSVLFFEFDNQHKIETVKLGGEHSANQITMTYADNTHSNQAWIIDGFNIKTSVKYNQENNLTEVTKQLGYSLAASQIDVTSYTYNTKGQLENIVFPDSGISHKEYEPITGLLTKFVKPNGQITTYTYQPRGEKFNLITKAAYLDPNTPIVTRYIYDDSFDKNGNRFLRFKISPEGKVTEYRPDARGNISNEREYLANLYDTSKFPPNGAPNLANMLEWVSRQDPEIISLKTYLYDGNGQVTNMMQFPNIDKNGNGVQDNTTGIEFIYSNMFGSVTQRKVYQDTQWSITNQRFDDLQRITEKRDALNNKTSYEYQDANSQIKITYPNTSSRITKTNASGLLTTEQATANSIDSQPQTRISGYERDNSGRIVVTTRPDGNQIYSFYDKQNRLGFTVSALGIVREYRYDRQNLYNTKIEYYTSIDPAKLKVSPTAENLINLLKQSANLQLDRYNTIFLDASGRKAYEVDAKNIVTQYFFDNLDRETARILYKNPLTDDQLKKLQSKQEINLIPDFNKDRCARIFYNKDNEIIGRQDSAGYITQYKIGINGKVGEKILYDKKMPIDLSIKDFNQLIPTPDAKKDARTYYYYNARKQLVSKINPKKYFFQYTYLRNGLKNQVTQFATPANTISPIPPVSTPEDQVTTYHYDLLNHAIQTELPYQSNHLKQYDNMENMVFDQIKDTKNSDNLDADHQRNTQAQYDGWNQKAREANPFVGSLLVNTNDPIEKDIIWKNKSSRHNFDNTGLKLSTTDSLGNTTYFYYDADRRPIIAISPRGRITETTLNSFGEEMNIRKYNSPISTTDLTGGFLTIVLRAKLNQLQDPLKDEITTITTDKRGQITQFVDPEGYTSTISYNAFKQKETENLPVADKTPSLIIQHEYEPSGLEITTTKTSNNQSLSIHRDYQNIYGKETLFVDEQGAQYQTEYDLNGQVSKKINPDNIVTTQKAWNGFGQILTDTNSQNAVTTYTYQQQTRSCITTYPENNATIKNNFNVFQEKISETDSLNNTKSVQHAPDGQVAVSTDALLNSTSNQFNLLGNITSITDPNNIQTNVNYDSDNQIESEIKDAQNLKLTTVYKRDMLGNATSIQDPKKNTTQQVFDRRNLPFQEIKDPNGLSLVTQKNYNGQKTIEGMSRGDTKKPNQYQETYGIDQFNRSTGKSIDPAGLNITTLQKLNQVGKVIVDIDPNGNVTRKFYDDLNRLRFVVDPAGGIVEKNYDTENRLQYQKKYEIGIDPNKLTDKTTLSELMALVKTDQQDSFVYYFYDQNGKERFQVNSLGSVAEKRYDTAMREIQTINYAVQIDPLLIPSLTTKKLADLMSQKISSKDRMIYKILDQKGQVRFEINLIDDNTKGYVTENRFDNAGNIIARAVYANKLQDPLKIATLPPDQVLANIVLNPDQDSISYKVFNAMNKLVFVVDGEGGVIKYDYDENSNPIQTTQFKDPIKVPNTYDQLVNLLKTLTPNPNVDSITKKIYDTANRLAQEQDPYLNKDIYELDTSNNIVKHTDRSKNNWIYQYDNACRLIVESTPPVDVTFVTVKNEVFDKNSSQDQDAKSFLKDQIPSSYFIGKTSLDKLESFYDSCAQSINQIYHYQKYNEKSLKLLSQIEDTGDYRKSMQLLSKQFNIKFHLIEIEILSPLAIASTHYLIDKNGYKNIDSEDKNKISYNGKNIIRIAFYNNRFFPILYKDNELQLTSTIQTLSIDKNIQYDKAGNKTSIIEAANTPENRQMGFDYDNCNHVNQTLIKSVAIDDPTKPASYNDRPEKIVDVVTQIVYSSKGKKVVEQSENGGCSFYIYDSEGREIYSINPLGFVIQINRNSFGESIQETSFAIPINLDLSKYIKTGISLSDIQQNGVIKQSPQDRVILFDRNNKGQVIQITKPNVFYYFIPKFNSEPVYGYANPKSIMEYNAFGKKVSVLNLYDPREKNIKMTSKIYWYNRNGNLVAECDEVSHITIYSYNAFGKISYRWEWANEPSIVPSVNTSFKELVLLHQNSLKDRWFISEYNLAGKETSNTRSEGMSILTLSITVQEPLIYIDAPPMLEDKKLHGLVKRFEYNPVGLCIAKTDEKGNKEYTYYDSRYKPIAWTGVTRTSEDEQKNPIFLTPLKYFGNDSCGNLVSTKQFKTGCTNNISPDKLPEPISPTIEDQFDLTLFDNRGVVKFKQDPNGNVEGFTYAPCKKIARQWNHLSNWKISYPQVDTVNNIDEKRFSFDLQNQSVFVEILRNNQSLQTNACGYNAFNELLTEGSSPASWQVFHSYDNLGRRWKTNYGKGAYQISLYGLENKKETAIVQSPVLDLSKQDYSQLSSLLISQLDKIELTQNVRDNVGRPIAKLLPGTFPLVNVISQKVNWSALGHFHEDFIPTIDLKAILFQLNIIVGNAYPAFGKISISWPTPSHPLPIYKQVFILYRGIDCNNSQILPIQTINGRDGVDVSAFPTDRYTYTLADICIKTMADFPVNYAKYLAIDRIQLHTDQSIDSQYIVTSIKENNKVYITGNTSRLNSLVMLYQKQGFIDEVLVQQDENLQYYIDLSKYPSGTYAIMPAGDNEDLSTPFTIYTDIPSLEPSSREINLTTTVLTLDSHMELIWNVPLDFSKMKIQIKCSYTGADGNDYLKEASIIPGNLIKKYTDANGGALNCNIEFEHSIQKVNSFSLSLILNDNITLLPLMKNIAPQKLSQDDYQNNNIILKNQFDSQTVVLITSLLDFTDPNIKFTYISPPQTVPHELPLFGIVNSSQNNLYNGIAINLSGITPGIYPYVFGQNKGTFSGSYGSEVYLSVCENEPPIATSQPYWKYTYDRWDNVVQQSDALGNTTKCAYNVDNKLSVQINPRVKVVNKDGNVTYTPPQTRFGYDQKSVQIGVCDANNHVEIYNVDAAGQSIEHVLGEGTIGYRQVFDCLGRVTIHQDGRKKAWKKKYDKNNNTIGLETPSALTTVYVADQKNHRICNINPSNDNKGLTYYYNFDPFNNIMQNWLPMGQSNQFTHDANHLLLESTDPDGNKLKWRRDYFGNKLFYIDYANCLYQFNYNEKMQPIMESSSNQTQTYNAVVTQVGQDIDIDSFDYSILLNPGITKYITYEYVGEFLTKVEDKAQQVTTTYTFDPVGRKIQLLSIVPPYQYFEMFIVGDADSTFYRAGFYDGGSKETLIVDGSGSFKLSYDAVGNRRSVDGTVGIFQTTKTISLWYDTDAAGRVIINQGVLQNGQIVLAPEQGMALSYEQGFRKTQSIIDSKGVFITRTFTYTDDGLLSQTIVSDGTTVQRIYDPAGWINRCTQTKPNTPTFEQIISCNANGWQELDQQNYKDSPQIVTQYTNFTGQGLPQSQVTNYYNINDSSQNFTDNITNTYQGMDEYAISSLSGTRKNIYGTSPISKTICLYNANNIISVILQDYLNVQTFLGMYLVTHDGVPLARRVLECVGPLSKFPINNAPINGGEANDSCFFHSLNGNLIASYSGAVFPLKKVKINVSDYIHPITVSFAPPPPPAPPPPSIRSISQNSSTDWQIGILSQANNVSFPPMVPGSYSVKDGDNFASIAQALFEDSNYASDIAFNNGWDSNDNITPGGILQLPQVIPMYTSVNTREPLGKFLVTMMGSLYPLMKAKLPPPVIIKIHKDSGGFFGGIFGEIFEFIIVAAACFVGGAAGIAVGSAIFGAGAAGFAVTTIETIAAAVVAAMTDAVGQGVAEVLGIQEHFSLPQALNVGLTEATVFALGGPSFSNFGKGLGQDIQVIGNALYKAGRVALLEQLSGMATGMVSKFNLKNVVDSIATTMADADVDSHLGSSPFVEGAVNDLVGVGVDQVIVHNSFNIANTVAGALGTGLGNELGASLARPLTEYTQKQEELYRESLQSNKKLGQNPNGMFSGNRSKNNANMSINSQSKTSDDDINWLTDSADKILGDDGLSIPDFDSNNSTTNNPFGFWSSASNGSDNSLTDSAHIGLGIGGIGAGVGEYSNVMGGMWRAANEEWYSLNWGGNQWTGGRSLATKAFNTFDTFGKSLFLADAVISGYEGYRDYESGDYFGAGKAALDIGMGAIGSFVAAPEAFAVATTYFVVDKFIGWNNVATLTNAAYEVDEVEIEQQLNNMGFRP
jgi:YD repeat-containing protein